MDNKINDTLREQIVGLEQIEKRVNVKLESIWARLPYFSAVGLALLVVGLFQFASVGFEPTALLKVQFWIPVAIISVSILIIFTSTAKEYEGRYASEDKDLQAIKKTISDKAKTQSFIKLPEFLAMKNIDLRIQRHREILDLEERKLDKKATKDDIYILANGSVAQKRDNKYCTAKEQIKEQRTDEYIKNHIAYMDFPKLLQYTMGMIIADIGINSANPFSISDNEIIGREAGLRVLSRAVFSAALGTLIITNAAVNLDTFIKLVGNVFMLVITFYDGVLLGKELSNTVVKNRAIERMQILDEFYFWSKNIDKKLEKQEK
jgi:hypothetical protein